MSQDRQTDIMGSTPTHTWSLFISWRRWKNSDYGLLLVTTGFTIATMSRSLCVFGSEAGDPAGLRFSVTHNINHVTEVGQTEQEIHLKCAGTARAGGRHCAPELITKWPHAAGSGCYCFSELKSKPGTFRPHPGTAWITEYSKTSGIYVVWSLNSWNQCLIIQHRRFFYSNLSILSRGSRAEWNEKRGERGSWLSRMRGIPSVQKPECWLCILPAGQFSWAKLQPPPGSDRYSSDTRRQLYGALSHLWKEQQG